MARTFTKVNGRWTADEGPSRYIQDKDTGFMQGRLGHGEKLTSYEKDKKHWFSKKDNTHVRRVIRPGAIKVNPSMGRRGTVRHYRGGVIIGRISTKK